MNEDTLREEGFAIFKNGMVRRLAPTHYVVKSQGSNGWHLIELKDGKWGCDCQSDGPACSHLYATQFHRYASQDKQEDFDEAHLKCRYCGSIDIARCGFRYNARGIARRFRCNDCQRKFSIPHVQNRTESKPAEIVWLINEVGMLITRLNDLLSELNSKLDQTVSIASNN